MESETDSEEDLIEKLVYATSARNVREVEHLIQAGIDPSTPTKRNGCSPLHTAAVLESPFGAEIVSRMLFYGANPDVKTPTGLSPLHIAAMWGRYETINVLLDNGADVADKDQDDMSALDYAEDAEDHKAQCIDSLTRYRANPTRRSRCFLTKSRSNLNRIIGGHVEFSTFLSEHSNTSEIGAKAAKQNGMNENDESDENIDDMITDVSELSINPGDMSFECGRTSHQTNLNSTPGNIRHFSRTSRTADRHFEKEIMDSPNVTLNDETLFQSCNENISSVVQSTMLEDLSDDLSICLPVIKESNSSANNRTASTVNGYSGDISQQNNPDASSSSSSMNETFWSVRTAPCSSLSTSNGESDENKENRDMNEALVLPPLKRRGKKSKLFVPLSPSYIVKRRGNEIVEIKPSSNSGDDIITGDKDKRRNDILHQNQVIRPSSNNVDNDNENDVISNKESSLHHVRNNRHEGSPSSNNEENQEVDLLGEETVNYSANRSVPELVDYYENDYAAEEFDPREETLSESPTKGAPKSPTKGAFFVVVNCRDTDLPPIQRRSIDELSSITISYDWKDVSQLKATEEPEDSTVVIPTSIQTLTNVELRERLVNHGEKPGPISGSTKKVYQRHLARIEANGGMCVNQRNKGSLDNRFRDYTQEMRQFLLGVATLSRQRGEELETEMAFTFDKPDKHTWREGTQKISFNYILLDPRVTNNLPDRCENMSVLEKFNVFASAIFYIGKGKKSRPYEHFHEAVKYEKNENKTKSASNKIDVILNIWESGYGVATVHIFHSVIPVEAYTREACMIEAMNLSRLTNAKRGDFYGPASSWPVKKKRQLGIYLLMKAMKIYLIEGEKQIKQRDIVK